jgi:N-acetylglucosamine-6-sulfatase
VVSTARSRGAENCSVAEIVSDSHRPPRRSPSPIVVVSLGVVLLGVLSAVGFAATRSAPGGEGKGGRSPENSRGRPSIVLILTDDQRWDELARMPTVQRQLVGKGVEFRNAFVTDPLCCPSRATILTGRYSHSTGIYWNRPPHGGFQTFRQEDRSTVATWLHAAGYRTALIGKYLNGYRPSDTGYVAPGWDVWDALALPGAGDGKGGYYNYVLGENGKSVRFGRAPGDYSTDVFTRLATQFIASTPSSSPLFLYYAPRAPHLPSTPAPRHASACPGLPPLRPPNYDQADVSDMPAYVRGHARLTPRQIAAYDRQHLLHCRSLLGVDDGVRAILEELRRTGRLSNTLFVYTSDQGYLFGEHRLTGKKVPYEESIRVPMVIRYDPVTRLTGRTDSHLVLNVDLAQTFAGAAGVKAPGAEGRSILPLLGDPNTPWRTRFLIEHWELPRISSAYVPAYCGVRTEHFVYVKYVTGEQEIYDLQRDPFELHNLAANPADAALDARLHSEMVKLCSPPPPGFTP